MDFEYVKKDGDLWRVKPIIGERGSNLLPWKVSPPDKDIELVEQPDVVVRKGRASARRMGARSDALLESW